MSHVAVLSILLLLKYSTSVEHELSRDMSEVDDTKDLQIIDSGIVPPTPDSMGIIFYVNLFNKSPRSLEVAAWMWRCCEKFDEKEPLCAHMKLVGGYGGIIASRKAKNISLFYPNLYVFNRVGECEIIVFCKAEEYKTKEKKIRIIFDTTLTSNQYPVTASKTCPHVDEDPLNDCTPVDCSRKYSGYMLFYSHLRNRCQLPPTSKDFVTLDGDVSNNCKIPDEMIKKVYIPESNRYDELVKRTNVAEVAINHTRSERATNEFDYIRCHHGIKSEYTGRCICYPDWTSVSTRVRPTTLLVHFCTIFNNKNYRVGLSPKEIENYISYNYFNSDSIIKISIFYTIVMLTSITFSLMYVTIYRYHVVREISDGDIHQTTILNTYISVSNFVPLSKNQSFDKSNLSFVLLKKTLKRLFGARLINEKSKKTAGKYELSRLIANEQIPPSNLRISRGKPKRRNRTRKRNKFFSSSTNVIYSWRNNQSKSWRQFNSSKSLKNKNNPSRKSSELIPSCNSLSAVEDNRNEEN